MTSRKPPETIASVPTAVPFPSADLINFRFDQIDKNLKENKDLSAEQFVVLNQKFDSLIKHFVPRDEYNGDMDKVNKAIDKHTDQITKLKATDDRQQGAIEAKKDFSATTLVVLGIVAAFVGGIISAILNARIK